MNGSDPFFAGSETVGHPTVISMNVYVCQ